MGFVWPGRTWFPDYSLPEGRDWWASYSKAFRASGFDGAWLDMNDPSVGAVELDDMLFDQGRQPHEAYHNQYALGMAKASREGFLAASRLDTTRLALDGARRELEGAQAAREMAVHERTQALAATRPAIIGAAAGRPLMVRAPVSGMVLRVPLQSEATVAAGAALLDIGDPQRMEIVAELLTTDAVNAKPGARASIERWGGPPLEARVRRVEPAAFTKVSALGIEEQRVNVLLDIASPPAAWLAMGDGFRVTVRVITASADDALTVPVGALFPHADGGMAVYVLDGSRARLQPVELAARNGNVGWVRAGLQAGQQVIVYPPPGVVDGRRVRVRQP